MIPAQAAFAWALQLDFQKHVAAQPLALQFVEILLAVDFMTYWVHRTFHKVPLLWNFHAIHHSSREPKNISVMLSICDRAFGTFQRVP